MNCWEFNRCGREAGGEKADVLGVCPAYPDHGRDCAQTVGTFCNGKVQGSIAQKLTSCLSCSFYNSEHHFKDMKSLLRLVTVIDQTAEAVVVTDTAGSIVYVNPAFSRITGYAQEEVLGKNPKLLKSGKHDSQFYVEMWQGIVSTGVWKGRITDRRKDGVLIDVETTITPIRDHHGNVSSYVAIHRDVTEIVALESQLRQAQRLQAVGSLASGIAHEINTPIQFIGDNVNFLSESFCEMMNAIKTAKAASLLLGNSLQGSQAIAEFVSRINSKELEYLETEVPRSIEQTLHGVERVSTLVRAMREFSHPDTKEKREVDLNKAIETTLVVARSELKHIANVVTDFAEDLPLLPCHLGPLNQVFLNLLVNSAHAIADTMIDEKAGMGTIRIKTERLGEEILVTISDTGTGIPKDIQQRVFDPFFTTKGVGKGTGQGLAIARSVVVDKHGGTLNFETEEGKGTTFFIRLPFLVERSESVRC